ncbi:hypothetical protein RHSIM_Rhsim01G0162600 [Rhododendron simsii]|uniref:EF-hand domain-containing protein n=1 Tax=Rhododendron simsii TaxID=118357 RepID=A0A834LW11_RHOSS|nr:hypothetical protein RHSIM_Rhsim01G0162600 [Rhododendron simsii]
MSDPFAICLIFIHKLRRKFIRKPSALRSNLNHRGNRRKQQSKRMMSDLTFLTSSFSSMEVTNQLKQVFEFLDANGDGKISPPELREVLLRLGKDKSVAEKEAERMVMEMDRDGDGLVDIDEFMDVVNLDNKAGGGGFGKEFGGGGDELMDAFMIFDRDKNGFISAKELQRVLVSLGCGNCSLRECREMIRGVDRDGNGLVDFDEFRSMMSIGFPC